VLPTDFVSSLLTDCSPFLRRIALRTTGCGDSDYDVVAFEDLEVEVHFLLPAFVGGIVVPGGTGGVGPGNVEEERGAFHIRSRVTDFSRRRVAQGETFFREPSVEALFVGVDVSSVEVSTHSGADQGRKGFILEDPDPQLETIFSLSSGVEIADGREGFGVQSLFLTGRCHQRGDQEGK
jgi:hypothetical protein